MPLYEYHDTTNMDPGIGKMKSKSIKKWWICSSINQNRVFQKRSLLMEPINRTEAVITYKQIGIIHSPFLEPKGTPIQAAAAAGIKGSVSLYPEYTPGLKDLEGFSHIMLLYHLHLSTGNSLLVKPFLDNDLHGVFATRSPSRPNNIGLSVVRLLGIESNILHIEDVDMIDGTPLLDIKPYVPGFDIRQVERFGWFEKNIHKLPDAKDDGRFSRNIDTDK
jgi:tRNA-Thr(GGU) m(6)t(6)A37 methyltransferase TsaA